MRLKEEVHKAAKYLYWFRNPDEFFRETTGYSPTPSQKEVLMALSDPKFERALISAPRGGGKTILMAAIAVWTLVPCARVMDMPYFVAIVSGSREQAIQLYNHFPTFLKHPFIISELKKRPLKTLAEFKDGGLFRAFPNSPKALRGPHPDVLLDDEAVETGAETILMAEEGVLWTKPYSRIIHSSTPHEFDSYFVEMWRDEERFKAYRRFSWTWRECFWKSKRQYEIAFASKPKKVIETEWEGRPFQESGGSIFDTRDIWDAGIKTKPLRVEGATVNLGIDWGFKRPTVIVAVQWLGEVVEVLHVQAFKEEDPEKVLDKVVELYHKLNVFKVFADASHIHENIRLQSKGLRVEAINFRLERVQLEANLIELLKSKRLRIWEGFDDLRYQMANYEPDSAKLKDYVDALLLACKRTFVIKERIWMGKRASWEGEEAQIPGDVPGWVSQR